MKRLTKDDLIEGQRYKLKGGYILYYVKDAPIKGESFCEYPDGAGRWIDLKGYSNDLKRSYNSNFDIECIVKQKSRKEMIDEFLKME